MKNILILEYNLIKLKPDILMPTRGGKYHQFEIREDGIHEIDLITFEGLYTYKFPISDSDIKEWYTKEDVMRLVPVEYWL